MPRTCSYCYRDLFALDGREQAPGRATPEMFFRNGKPEPELSQRGPLAAGIPGLVAALDRMSQRWGKIGWQASLVDAASVARDVFESIETMRLY